MSPSPSLDRRRLLQLATSAATLAAGSALSQAGGKPLSIVLPFSPGGSTDSLMRLLAEDFGRQGRPAIVENKPGASAIIGAQYAAKAPPDGRILFFGSNSSLVNNIALFDKLPYDPVAEFVPVSMIGATPMMLVARMDAPYKTLPELIAHAKANPGRINRGHAGQGNISNLGPVRFEQQQGFSTTPIPFAGDAPMMTALLGDNLDIFLGSSLTVRQAIAAGRMRGLAVMGPKRYLDVPDMPTARELGFHDADMTAWYMFMAAAATPPALVSGLNNLVNVSLSKPEVAAQARRLGIEPMPGSQTEAAKYLAEERARWIPLIRSLGLKG